MKLVSVIFIGLAMVVVGCDNDPFAIGARNRSSPALKTFDSCASLHSALQDSWSQEMRIQLMSQLNYGGGWGMLASDGAAERGGSQNFGDEATGAPKVEGKDYSGTNNQEAGVDEADFVKTDGDYLYILNGSRLEILGVPAVGQVTTSSTTELEGWPTQMLIGDDRVVVFSRVSLKELPTEHPLKDELAVNGTELAWYRFPDVTKISVVKLTDMANPTVERELYIEGTYQTGRRVDDTVRMVNFTTMDVPGVKYWAELPPNAYDSAGDEGAWRSLYEKAARDTIAHNDKVIYSTSLDRFLPVIYERRDSAVFVKHGFTAADCQNFAMAEDGASRGVTSILSLDLLSDAFAFDHDHIISNWAQVYSSQDVMIIAEPSNGWWWYWDNEDFKEATNIHRFDISQAGLAAYTGSGRVAGTTNDQFSFSEFQGNIRVAATTGRWNWWSEDDDGPENHVFVLAGKNELSIIGQISGIAKGESIWSSRFIGDRGYLVTFRNIDPLWTIDLSDPQNPAIMGELEVEGVSTYIHPLGDDHLLTIGYSGNAGGLDWNAQVSLFDVTDFSTPLLADALPFAPPSSQFGWHSAWSEALHEHKAFTFWDGLLAIPLSTYRDSWDANQGEYHYEYLSYLQLVDVDLDSGLSLFGQIDHSAFYNAGNDYHWWYNTDVRRTIFMRDKEDNNYVYAISERGVTVHRIDGETLVATDSQALPGPEKQPFFWW